MILLWVCIFGLAFQHIQCVVYEHGVPTKDQMIIVNKHNEYRAMAAEGSIPNQPRATNMKQMKWDAKLGHEAQKIADTLEFEHKEVTDDRWSNIGQNLYTGMSTQLSYGASWSDTVTIWYNEVQNYKFGSGWAENTAHYTQVVWANSEYIGCGYTLFSTNGTFPYQTLYVCNYGPGGNIGGENPYETK